MNWFLKALIHNYANFSGRARRQEYWMFVLIQIIIFILIGFLASFVEELLNVQVRSILFGIYLLGTLTPWLALNVRRLHDIGKSGAYFFINLIPVIGRIWFLILVCTNGEGRPNRYGLDPKGNNFDEINDIGKIELE